MRRLSTIAGLALFCAAFSLAYPQPQPSWQDLQQRPFSPFHHTTQHVDPDLGADSKGHIGTYARFDNEQVLRVEISSFDQLKQLEAAVEVSPRPTSCVFFFFLGQWLFMHSQNLLA
jgi:hypothetical protein